MKTRSILAAAMLVLAASSAQATVWSGTNLNLGSLDMGSEGTIKNNFTMTALPKLTSKSPTTYLGTDSFHGSVASGTELVFTFNLPNLIGSALLDATYAFTKNSHNYSGDVDVNIANVWHVGWLATPFSFVSANLTGGHEVITIDNTSGKTLDFTAFFSGLFSSNKQPTISVTSECIDVSRVPLPAALPLFLAGLAGIFTFQRFKRRINLAA